MEHYSMAFCIVLLVSWYGLTVWYSEKELFVGCVCDKGVSSECCCCSSSRVYSHKCGLLSYFILCYIFFPLVHFGKGIDCWEIQLWTVDPAYLVICFCYCFRYEAWVIYNFFSLCLAWVGGPGAVVVSLNGRSLKPSWCLMTCCFPPIPLDGWDSLNMMHVFEIGFKFHGWNRCALFPQLLHSTFCGDFWMWING